MTAREELVMLLEERTLSHFERRKRRLARIPSSVRSSALRKAWKNRHCWEKEGQERLRVTRDEWIVLHLGWLPEEREKLIEFMESRGYKRCRNCGRAIVSDGPYDRCVACGSLHCAPQPNLEQKAQL